MGQDELNSKFKRYTQIEFIDILRLASTFSDHIKNHREELVNLLLEYETYEVATDEIARTFDLLGNLEENEEYFKLRIGKVASFLPRNQPLYAFTCFVVIPSLMASEVHFRIPHGMRSFFPKVLALLQVERFFPNIYISQKERFDFLYEHSALYKNPNTSDSLPITDVVIFTGRSANANKLRAVFDRRTLFIANGAGHNPLVVSSDANIENAVDATLTLLLYNQGQDCAAPNSVLVKQDIFPKFLQILRDKIKGIGVGSYNDRSCRVGPISDPNDLVEIQKFLVKNQQWLDPTTPGIINTQQSILKPTIISKPLIKGGNFTEIFAPIIFLQKYENDDKLTLYFEDQRYASHAMYISVYGTSKYIESLIDRKFNGSIIHGASSILHNTHLHAEDVERGTQQYGGYGYDASSLSINGSIMPQPTLPQRDIHKWIAKPLLNQQALEQRLNTLKLCTEISHRNVQKLLRTRPQITEEKFHAKSNIYIDTEMLKDNQYRFVKLEGKNTFSLLNNPNIKYFESVAFHEVELIKTLCDFLHKQKRSAEEIGRELYDLPKKADATGEENQAYQLAFFGHIYQLLFGKPTGPHLPKFLVDADKDLVCKLLNPQD